MRHTVFGRGVPASAWVWLLAGLMLLATLAPAISRTLETAQPVGKPGWTEVCGAHGVEWVPTDASAAADAPAPGADADLLSRLDACGYCVLATGRGTPPVNFDDWGLVAAAPAPCPHWVGHPFFFALARTPQARGPPVVC